MLRQTLFALSLVSIVGCSASTSVKPVGSNTNRVDETSQQASYATRARFPENSTLRTDLQAAAIVNPQKGTIQIINFTDKPLAPGNIWINRAYVQRFDSIPARGKIDLPRARFYDRAGQSLGGTTATTDSVQLQWDNDVYTLLGPVYQ